LSRITTRRELDFGAGLWYGWTMQEVIRKNQKELQEIFRKEGVTLAYLFGSHARGTTHHFSDIDIGVLLDRDISKDAYFDKTLKLIGELGHVFRTEHVDVVVLNQAKPFLRYQIIFGGKLLFEKNAAIRIFYGNNAMKEYQDTKHILQLSLNAMKERIKRGSFGINPRSAYGPRS